MHTNATIDIDAAGTTATLSLGGKRLIAQFVNPPAGMRFQRLEPVRTTNAPQLNTGQAADQPNPGVSVLAFDIPAGTNTAQVLFNPQWDGFTNFRTPASVPLSGWSLDSH